MIHVAEVCSKTRRHYRQSLPASQKILQSTVKGSIRSANMSNSNEAVSDWWYTGLSTLYRGMYCYNLKPWYTVVPWYTVSRLVDMMKSSHDTTSTCFTNYSHATSTGNLLSRCSLVIVDVV